MSGEIEGGWGFVLAAYGIVWVVGLGWAAALLLGRRAARRRAARRGARDDRDAQGH